MIQYCAVAGDGFPKRALTAQRRPAWIATVDATSRFPALVISLTSAPESRSFSSSRWATRLERFRITYLQGNIKINNIGYVVTAGFEASGNIGLADGIGFDANRIATVNPLTPTVTASGSVGFRLGGQVIVGPGAGTKFAGVIAGVNGELYPIDANFGPVFPISDPRFNACLRAQAKLTVSLGVTAKAWLGNWDINETFNPDALEGSFDYPGSPWYYPASCQNAADPGGTVLGENVTKISDSVPGGQNQIGYVPGFVPGKQTWVLSTGNIAAAVGSPSSFASTNLGRAGDADLSSLAGRTTYDAASYSVTLVPAAPVLHVRYAFASEEYPEYVGSSFNDVMAVFVNGVNCAKVPGTNSPVSINTVNASTNSVYYIDNTTGASGYGTTMDGLTKPLECKVGVTVGQPVTIKIAVADASDRIYDSAVVLLDQGIWADFG